MANKVRVVIKKAGVRKLLQSQEMLDMTKEAAEEIGSNMKDTKTFVGFDRAKTFIYKKRTGK